MVLNRNMTQSDRIKEIVQFIEEYGVEKAQQQFGLKSETLHRYIRASKQDTRMRAKILILDIETAPMKAYVWRRWKQNVGDSQIISRWFVLTWSAKWLFDSKVMSARLSSKDAKAQNDKSIVAELRALLDEADIVIAHNGERYDIPQMNARFIVHGLKPTRPYQQIDTLKIARRQFDFDGNGLDNLANIFGISGKIQTSFELWERCVDGETKALKEMEHYNKQDVLLLEEMYLKMRPWIKSHPNLGLYVDAEKPVCSSCGSIDVVPSGEYVTTVGIYDTHQCNDCGAFSRERASRVSKEKRKSLLVSIAR